MSGLLSGAPGWLMGTLLGDSGVEITYTVKAGTYAGKSLTFLAMPGRSLLQLSANYDQRLQRTDSDFVFPQTSLVFGGANYRPQRGDTIHATLNGVAELFEVRPYGDEPVWTWSDQTQVNIRVRTHYQGSL